MKQKQTKIKVKKQKKVKEPTLLRKLIEIHHEQALARKAMRNLSKLEWSVDFLCYVVAKAAKLTNSTLEITLVSKARQELHIRSIDKEVVSFDPDDDILNKLDDTQAVNDFIRRHST